MGQAEARRSKLLVEETKEETVEDSSTPLVRTRHNHFHHLLCSMSRLPRRALALWNPYLETSPLWL